jgi:hypothetical protein
VLSRWSVNRPPRRSARSRMLVIPGPLAPARPEPVDAHPVVAHRQRDVVVVDGEIDVHPMCGCVAGDVRERFAQGREQLVGDMVRNEAVRSR